MMSAPARPLLALAAVLLHAAAPGLLWAQCECGPDLLRRRRRC